QFQNCATNVFTMANTGATTLLTSTNSTTAFHVQDLSANPIFTEDRTTGKATASTALQAPTFDTASAVGMNIGTTNATSLTLGKNTTNVDIQVSATIAESIGITL